MDIPIKIVLVGDSGVGKSSLITRYCRDTFQPSHYATIGTDLTMKKITLPSGPTVMLHLFDTAGQERYRALSKNFYRNSHGVVLVYDCASRESFDSLETWLEEVDQICPEGTKRLIIGNKSDLQSEIDPSEVEAFSKRAEAKLFSVSAKTGERVNKAFERLVTEIMSDPPDVFRAAPLHPENSGSYCCTG